MLTTQGKCTVEPVIGIIKEVLGFRQFSLRGLEAAAGEWCLVGLAFNLKRLHTLLQGDVRRLEGRVCLHPSAGPDDTVYTAVLRRWRFLTRHSRRCSGRLTWPRGHTPRVFSPTGC